MILVLNNGERVEIFRQNCGYEYKNYQGGWSREWNTNPEAKVSEGASGFLVIGTWGTIASDPCEKKIPISSITYIERTDEWEKPGTFLNPLPEPEDFIDHEEMDV